MISASPITARWIDAHCHLADERLKDTVGDVVARSSASGVGAWIQGGIDPADWSRQLDLCVHFGDAVVPVFGLHPWIAAKMRESEIRSALTSLEALLPKAQALGETGLDLSPRHTDAGSLPLQLLAFREQLMLGKSADKPLILHVVRAHGQALETLEKAGPFKSGGLIHGFSGSFETAQRYLRLGFVVSIGTSIARPGRSSLKQALRRLAPQDFVIETDSPDQAPDGAMLNEPARLMEVAKAVEELTGRSAESILDQSASNLRRLLKL